mmetsp:Transcript_64674/g.126967  ORF Transcript_64674/g.126967 Transcript_64674/m.126967 type:complete len:213 (+) Transcript_64674:471-1109(+)
MFHFVHEVGLGLVAVSLPPEARPSSGVDFPPPRRHIAHQLEQRKTPFTTSSSSLCTARRVAWSLQLVQRRLRAVQEVAAKGRGLEQGLQHLPCAQVRVGRAQGAGGVLRTRGEPEQRQVCYLHAGGGPSAGHHLGNSCLGAHSCAHFVVGSESEHVLPVLDLVDSFRGLGPSDHRPNAAAAPAAETCLHGLRRHVGVSVARREQVCQGLDAQ